jgi:purine-nucleoside phosphorylase
MEVFENAASELAALTGIDRHEVFVALGSGWGSASGELPGTDVPFAALPGFPTPTVNGHAGVFRSTTVGTAAVLLGLGRVHLYEGHSPATVAHAVRTAAAAGCRIAVLTNAAGVLNHQWPVGSVAVIRDQINMTGVSPLLGTQFVDLTDLYSRRLRAALADIGMPEGVYVGTHGPEFETPAEIRAYANLGADLVGMSTVLEAIAARHAGMEVVGLSLITNLAAGLTPGGFTISHVWDAAESSAVLTRGTLLSVLARLTPLVER